MIEKMTLEQFQQIKRQLADIIKEVDDYEDDHIDNLEDYNVELELQRFVEKYFEIQNRLLSYDLSDIPFEAWQGMAIVSDESHVADFSKTKANIDFGLIEYDGNGNFRGCNVRNLDRLELRLNPNDFDEQTIHMNSSIFLSDDFSSEFKEKYYRGYLSVGDLASLSSEQLEEIKQKDFGLHMRKNMISYSSSDNDLLLDTLGLDKVIQLYNYSQQDYEAVTQILNNRYRLGIYRDGENDNIPTLEEFLEQIKNVDVTQIKSMFYSYVRKALFKGHKRFYNIDVERLPESFVKENNDILLIGENIPDDLRQRYYTGRLTLDDIINNISLFKNIPISKVTEGRDIGELVDALGEDNLLRYIEAYPEIFNYIIKSDLTYQFINFVSTSERLNLNQTDDVKQKLINYLEPFLSTHNKLVTGEQLMAYDTSLFPLDEMQQLVIDTLNLDNIKRFEKETHFFSINNHTDLQMFQAFTSYFKKYSPSKLAEIGIDFKNGTLSYEEFLDQLAKCLDHMKRHDLFTNFPNYDFIEGEFRDKHPEIFVDINAPIELKDAFYRNRITPEFLFQHKDYISYLTDKNLLNTLIVNINLRVPSLVDEKGKDINFVREYVSRYGNEKLLQLVSKYGDALSNITITSFHDEIENEQAIEQSLRNAIYNKIINKKMNYSYLTSVPEFVSEYPEIFVNFDNLTSISQEERQRLTKAFYDRTLSFDDIKKYPELADYLKDKNLPIAFGYADNNDLQLLEVFGNEKFLQLCTKYGRYMDGIALHLNKDILIIRDGKHLDYLDGDNLDVLSFEDISKRIENIIIRESKLGNLAYRPDDAPSFLKEREPELFLSEDAPEELKNYFYNYGMSFEVLQKHKDWLPFLKDKALITSLLRNNDLKNELIQYLHLFGEEKGIKLGINRAETVKEMMKAHQVELMKSWYDKTGGKFIPDFVVMQNFSLEKADKFLISGSNWSNLMRIQSFARTSEARDAMLKLAYSFGAFDQDQRGFKKLQDLLTGLPKKIDSQQGYIFDRLDDQIDLYSQRGVFFKNSSTIHEDGSVTTEAPNMTPEEKEEAYKKMIEYVKKNNSTGLLDKDTLVNLLEALKKEKVNIDFSRPIFSQLYRKNEDGTYSLTINPQSCQKSSQAIRGILEKFGELPILTPDMAHRYFGSFKLEYDPDFREFFLANYDTIISDDEYLSQISVIQRRFSEIKAVYSNVTLTLDLVMSYIDNNKYENVNVGNEGVEKVAALQNYSQADFEILQQIYNYGKQRTFSSIPRVVSNDKVSLVSGDYYYEILRLDDPRAMSIGFESDCCQELHNCAETCMEHSMVDKNGRVFIITNEAGEIVAQSWVWRNKDVLCFDNIEVPDQKMWDNGIPRGKENSGIRNQFTDDILTIYKMVAHELIEVDEKVYRELLDSGKITQEQYEGLKLGKITSGLGYSNIKGSLYTLSTDKTDLSRPLPFKEPVKLSRGLYTSDSTRQYVLEERDDRKKFDGETLPVHSDTYVEYTDENFTEKSLLSLEKLEIVTKEDPGRLETSIGDYADSEHLVTELAKNYGLNPETARIIMNPNFAIIYDVNGDKLRVGDLLFNTRVDIDQQQVDIESKVVMQMKLALEQIASDKEIDVSALDEKQKEMYEKITGLTDEMDIERGVGHAR